MGRGYNVTQVELIFYSKYKLIIVITVVTYIGLIIVPIGVIVVCPFTTCINYKPMHVFNLLMSVGLRMYVGLHVCMYVFIYVCMYGCRPMYVHLCTYVGLCMHVRTYVCMYVCMCVC